MAIDTAAEAAMFETVTNAEGMQFEPGRYLLKVVRLEPASGEFGPQIKWIMNVAANANGSWALTRNSDGEPYEWHQYTSLKLSPKAKARKWAEAFLGRELEDGESGGQVASAVIGCKALALIGPNDKGYSKVLQIDPAPKGKEKAPPPPPVADDEDEI